MSLPERKMYAISVNTWRKITMRRWRWSKRFCSNRVGTRRNSIWSSKARSARSASRKPIRTRSRRINFNLLIYGKDNIRSRNILGTIDSVNAITLDDLKAFYAKSISPSVARMNVVGALDKAKITSFAQADSTVNGRAKRSRSPFTKRRNRRRNRSSLFLRCSRREAIRYPVWLSGASRRPIRIFIRRP